jgi:DNA-binding SARP family transcriptional activator
VRVGRRCDNPVMASREAEIAFGVLGPLQVSRGGGELEFGSPQIRLVLAALLVDANVVVSADRLVEVLWGDEPPPKAASSVQKLVYRLRSLLGSGSDEIVVTRAPGYVLHVGPGCLDAARFESLVVDAQAMKRRSDAAETVRLLDGALRLWRGPAFAEFAFAEFARAEAARLDELR